LDQFQSVDDRDAPIYDDEIEVGIFQEKQRLFPILFVLFDVEAVFIYPWAIQFRSLGFAALGSMAVFLLTLAVALAYVWKKGALTWAK